MPKLCVEYAKSGRAKCSLTSCGKKIEKNELRIGTEVVLPYSDDGVESWKWRHLCCFTDRQLANAKASGDIDDIQGEDELAPADVAMVARLRNGELIGETRIIGRIGDIARSRVAPPPGRAAKPKKSDDEAASSPSAAVKRPRAASAKAKKKTEKDAGGGDVDSEATDEYEVAVEAVSGRPPCPYGERCFRTNPEHFQQYAHPGRPEDDGDGSAGSAGAAPVMKPVIKRKK